MPSTFTRDAVAAATEKPVHVVPHPLPPMTATPDMRGKLGLPADALVVLNVFHLGSAFSRKNPLAAIAAFRKAFGDAPNRVLAIKVIDNGAQWARRELDTAIAGAGNIRLIEGMLPEADMAGLMAAADIVISLHRSEGFGLVPAQAMALGQAGDRHRLVRQSRFHERRTIRRWCPIRSFRCAIPKALSTADGQIWADADVEEAAAWLRRLAGDAESARQHGRRRRQGRRRAAFAQAFCRARSPRSSKTGERR